MSRVASHVEDVASCSIACAACTTQTGCEAASGSWGYATVSLCVTCSPGKSRAAGDDASTVNTIANPDAPIVNGSPQITGILDTYCAAVACGVDEEVTGHVCESCPPGTVNPLSKPVYGCFSPMNTCTGTQAQDTDRDGSTGWAADEDGRAALRTNDRLLPSVPVAGCGDHSIAAAATHLLEALSCRGDGAQAVGACVACSYAALIACQALARLGYQAGSAWRRRWSTDRAAGSGCGAVAGLRAGAWRL